MSDEFRYRQRRGDTDLPEPTSGKGLVRRRGSKTLLWLALGVIAVAVFVVIIALVFR